MRVIVMWIVRVGMLSLVALTAGAPVLAQDHYPNRTVRLVVGFGAGGPTDIPARHIADKLGTLLGQRLIVENKTRAESASSRFEETNGMPISAARC